MDLQNKIIENLRVQLGGLTFELCAAQARVEMLEHENEKLREALSHYGESDAQSDRPKD